MERVKATPESYARKIDFIEKAMAEGAHLRLPRAKAAGRPMSKEAWNRIVDIGLLYHAGPETTGPSIAAMYNVTGEAIRQTRNRFIVDLYKNSSKETRQKFPLDSIALSKPVTLPQREKMAKIMGGLSLKVRSLIGEGVTDSEVIISRLETTRARLKAATKSGMFKEWGLTLPVENINRSFKEVEGKVESMTDDRQLQEYLDSFSDSSLRGFIHRKNTTQAIFGNLSATLKEMGVKNNRYARPVALKLRALGLPVRLLMGSTLTIKGRQYQETYFVYFSKRKQRIMEAVEAMGPLENNSEIISLKKAKS